MSRIRKEISQQLLDLESDGDGVLTARFRFSAAFAGFQGHFEGNPVLPGICKVMAVLEMFSRSGCGAQHLREVVQAKFFSPVLPEETISIRCESKKNTDGSLLVKAAVQKEAGKVALLQMVVENA